MAPLVKPRRRDGRHVEARRVEPIPSPHRAASAREDAIPRNRPFLDRIATHMLAFPRVSHAEGSMPESRGIGAGGAFGRDDSALGPGVIGEP